jgi:carboxyl-terminal processing protease
MRRLIKHAILPCLAFFALPIAAEQAIEANDERRTLPIEELETFADVFHQIRENYVEDIDDRSLLMLAIEGMLNGLDPHSRFLQDDDLVDLEENTTGEFGGLGVEVGSERGLVKIIAPMDNTPAAKAGLQSGDLISHIDGQPVVDMNVNDAIDMMRGEPGSTIELKVLRENEDAPLSFSIERDIIKVRSVRSRMIDRHIGYLRIAQFQQNTAQDVDTALQTLQKDVPLQGLVIDLRNNPGGLLEAAVKTSDIFLDKGLVVYTEGRDKQKRSEYIATPGDLLATTPIAVIINGGSASAAEILAGALQDHRRAVIIGTPSFGKGSVQTVVPLNEHQAIKLTTSRYFTPNGRSIQAHGIDPDIIVAAGGLRENKERRLKEADLPGHLTNAADQTDAEPNDSDDGVNLPNDAQLVEAYNLLKAMQLLKPMASSMISESI